MAEGAIGPDIGSRFDDPPSPVPDEQVSQAHELLHEVIDPGVGVNIVDLGLVYAAIFLGFVISMIFAHAPVIVPAVLGRTLRGTGPAGSGAAW